MDITEILAGARLPEKTVRLCLRPDLLAAYEDAEVELERAKEAAKEADSLGGGGVRQAAERVLDLRRQMTDASVTFLLRAVGRRRWTSLLAEHPPREKDSRDQLLGYNRDTLYDALTFECLAEPKMSREQFDELSDRLSTAQWDTLASAAWEVNQSGVDVPFSLAASQALNSSEPESVRLNGSGSASSGSTAGSRSRSTSTTKKGGSSRRAPKSNGTPNSKP